MDATKQGIEEKRVKSTIIRRRAKVETPEPAPVETPAPQVEAQVSAAPLATATSVIQDKIQGKPNVVASPTAAPGPSTVIKPTATHIVGRIIPPPSASGQKQAPSHLRQGPAAQGANAGRQVGAGAAAQRPDAKVDPRSPFPPAAAPSEEAAQERDKPKKTAKKKSRDELDMEMFSRAGGLKKAAELLTVAPERLERVFKPDKNAKKKKVVTKKEFKKTEITTPKAAKRVIRIENMIIVSDLAKRMSIKVGDILKKLMDLGTMATINQAIDHDTAVLVAQDFGYEVENVAFTEESVLEQAAETKDEAGQEPRPAIVTVMGHVDHGKTSLLDYIRKAQVAAGEAGGITQHIGAYDVQTPKGTITFIDTPGHEAFTAMRARGAKVTDIVILVVAADDGIMPQTIEAIHHAKAAQVPIIVAMNKIDKPDADRGRVERGLMEQGLVSEQLGGDTIIAPVSAKTGEGIDHLLEMILIQSEVLELKANPNKRASGTIIEARLDKGRGPVATIIVQEGTLRVGDVVIAGTAIGKVRALMDALGRQVKEAGPSKPVEVLGLSSVPMAGDKFYAMDSEADARDLLEHRQDKIRQSKIVTAAPMKLEDLYAQAAKDQIPELRVIIKGDVQGSVEAIRESVNKLSGEKIRVSILHVGVGAVTESDVMLALASQAIIIGFNVRPDANGRQIAEREKVEIRTYSIIYDVVNDVKKAMEGMLKPLYSEKYLGRAEVRQVFTVSKVGSVAGCGVTDGKILRNASVRVLRDGKVVYQGKLSSLKRFKDDAREVPTGMECGMSVDNYNDIKVGDVLEAFSVEEIAQKL